MDLVLSGGWERRFEGGGGVVVEPALTGTPGHKGAQGGHLAVPGRGCSGRPAGGEKDLQLAWGEPIHSPGGSQELNEGLEGEAVDAEGAVGQLAGLKESVDNCSQWWGSGG